MYSKINAYFQNYETFSKWKELYQVVSKIINDKPKHVQIPGLVARAYGCENGRVIAASACLALVFSAVIILDDLLDGDQRFSEGEAHLPDLANMSAALVALAFQTLQDFLVSEEDYQIGVSTLSEMLQNVAIRQALDVRNPCSEAEYWEVARLKSGAFFSGAFALGGLVSGVGKGEYEVLRPLGREFGIMIQIHDDLRDSLEVPANPDWKNGRHSLPILFTELVDHPWQERFKSIRSHVDDQKILSEAQQILIQCGALSYGMHQIEQHYKNAMQQLGLLRINNPAPLKSTFDELIDPVYCLVEKLLGSKLPN